MDFNRLPGSYISYSLSTRPLAFCGGLLVLLCCYSAVAQGDTRLVDAAEHQDWPEVKKLANDLSSVNAQQVDGMTALHWAAWHDQTAVAKFLIEHGANVRLPNRYGVQPLVLACSNGNRELVADLLNAKADVHIELAGGETPLHVASRTGSVACVQLLLRHGADPNCQERKGQTPLMWAAAEGHSQVVEALIAAGARFREALPSGFTPLLFAAREGRIAVVDVLLRHGADVNEVMRREKSSGKAPRNGTSPLILAVENGHFQLAQVLLDAGADPNDQRSGFAPLHMLTWVRKPNRGDGDDGDPAPNGSGDLTSLQCVRSLVAHGADVNLRLKKGASGRGVLNKTGATPFLMAAATDDLPMMKLLVELGADPLLPNADQCTPLMAAAGIGVLAPGEEAGSEDEALGCVEYLLALGADVNALDANGETAMHGAAYKSLPRMVELLASRGADPRLWNRANKYGWSPLDIAAGHRPGNFKPSEATHQALQRLLGKH